MSGSWIVTCWWCVCFCWLYIITLVGRNSFFTWKQMNLTSILLDLFCSKVNGGPVTSANIPRHGLRQHVLTGSKYNEIKNSTYYGFHAHFLTQSVWFERILFGYFEYGEGAQNPLKKRRKISLYRCNVNLSKIQSICEFRRVRSLPQYIVIQ